MLNNITISGRLVADPELRHTKGSEPILVVNFRIANDRNYKNSGETVTDFFHCTAWRKKAEFINEYFSKGDMITVVGSIHNNSYTDNNGPPLSILPTSILSRLSGDINVAKDK